jgi:Protein of unknown function (DUF3352)
MRIPLRAARRLAVTGWFALAGLLLVAAQGRAATPPEKILPDSTIAFVKINNAAALRQAFLQSQYGQLWNDPAVKLWKDDILDRVDAASKTLKEKIGVTYQELFELPQGPTAIAFLRHENPQIPIVLLVIADAGKNAATMTEVLTKATKQGELNGAKISSESFRGVTIRVIQPPKEKADPAAKDKPKDDQPEPPIVWTNQGSVFYLGSDVAALKDLISHEQGREDSLASTESFGQAFKKLSSDSQVFWYVELPRFLKLMAQSGAAANPNADNPNQAQQTEAMIQVTGLNGLKAATGSFTLNAGNYDSLTKTHILMQGPPQGVVKVFRLPKVTLQPEPWVPASVASYQTISWDLDQAFVALNELANLFQPGVLQVLEQQMVGPNGGEPLKFKQDIFDPLGDRITIVSDFKKPVTEDSERMLLAIALEDSKALQNSLNKLISLTGGQPKKREFQGTTIYDFEVPEMPNPNGGVGGAQAPGDANLKPRGPVSVAIAKQTLFISSEPTLLEQVLRGGGPALADSSAYQAVAREMPGKVSSLTYVRPDEQARITYDMIKSGQFEKALQGAAVAGGPDLSRFARLIDKEKLPDFSVFAKYLSQGGRFSEMNDDGVTITGFTLRKAKP